MILHPTYSRCKYILHYQMPPSATDFEMLCKCTHTVSPAESTDNVTDRRLCDADVTGNDVTHSGVGGSKVRPATDRRPSTLFSHLQSTGSINGGNEATKSKRGVWTADFSQQTVQDRSTQTPVALVLCCFDDYGFLNRLDHVVMSRDQAVADQPWWMCLTETGR